MNGATAAGRRGRPLSGRERWMLVLGAAAVAAFLGYRGFVRPRVAEYRRLVASIPGRLQELDRFRFAAGGAPRVEAAIAEAEGRIGRLEAGLLPGESPAAAGVALQGILKPWLERPDTRVVSVRALPPEGRGDYAEVAVQVDLQTTVDGLAFLLARAAQGPKILKVRKLTVSSGYYGYAAASQRETLVTSVVLAGLARPAGVAAAEADDGKGRGR